MSACDTCATKDTCQKDLEADSADWGSFLGNYGLERSKALRDFLLDLMVQGITPCINDVQKAFPDFSLRAIDRIRKNIRDFLDNRPTTRYVVTKKNPGYPPNVVSVHTTEDAAREAAYRAEGLFPIEVITIRGTRS